MCIQGKRGTAETPTATVEAGATSVQLVAANEDRTAIWVSNGHATQVAWLSLGTTDAVVGSGIKVPAGVGGPVLIPGYNGPIQVIASGATTPVGYTEL